MVCTDCKYWWYGSCTNVKGASKLKKPEIDSISKTWLCHWCYVCPYQRPENRPSALKQQSLINTTLSSVLTQHLRDSITELVQKSDPVVDISGIEASLEELGRNLNDLKSQKLSSIVDNGPQLCGQCNFKSVEELGSTRAAPVHTRRQLTCQEPP